MIIYKYKKFFLKIEHVHFSKDFIFSNADIIYYFQCQKKHPNSSLFKSPVIYLNSDIDLIKNNLKGKGYFGNILEEFYFFYKPNSDSEPDFPLAELELKSSPLKKLKSNEFRSKERLVLNIINYINVVKQDFEKSDFVKKNSSILLVFYLHERDKNVLEYIIKLIGEWSFPLTDLEIIKYANEHAKFWKNTLKHKQIFWNRLTITININQKFT